MSFLFGWEWKSGEMEKVSLYKFTHIPLLKNDIQLKLYLKKSCLIKQKKKKKNKTTITLTAK